MSRPGTFAAAGAVAVVTASAAALFAVSTASPTLAPVDISTHTVPATQAQLSCPESTVAKGVSTSLLAVAPPVDQPSAAGAAGGELDVHPLSTAQSQTEAIGHTDTVGVPVTTQLDAQARPSVTVDAVGDLAPAAYAAQSTVLKAGQRGGLALAPCRPSGDVWWFTGVDTSVGSTSRLVLSNPSPAVAEVGLTLYGPKGIVAAVGSQSIPLAPRSRESLDLARFAPGLDEVGLRVKATRGRVSAAVDVARVNGITAAGNEWITPSEPPSTDVLVDAGDAGPGEQRLVITNPSAREALVQVQVLDAGGPFTPDTLTDIRIKPGRTVVKDVSRATGTSAAALHVTTDGEAIVLATLVSESSQPVVDLATSSSSVPLTGPAVIPVFSGTPPSVAVSSVQPGGGVLRIQAYDATGRPVGDPTRLSVKSRTTATADLRLPAKAAYFVATVTDGEGLQAVATYHGDTGLSAIPIQSGTTTVTRPAVRPAQ